MANGQPTLSFIRHPVGRLKRLKRAAKRRLGLFDPLQILPFRSCGTAESLWVMGRVLEHDGVLYDTDDAASAEDVTHSHDGAWQNLRASLRRFRSDEIPDASLAVRFRGVALEVQTDSEGYFHVQLQPPEPLEAGWHEVGLELLTSMAGSEGTRAVAQVLVPPATADFGVISDIDDTVIHTGAVNRLKMLRTVLFHNARTRKPLPGVAAFYRALTRGPLGTGHNPHFYVSRSGWNLYDLFDAFFELHGIPRGPLFLTDIALLEPKSSALGSGEDKPTRIRRLLDLYPGMRFVLVGDSGQRDPEIYRDIVLEAPHRIRAVYIRDITGAARSAKVAGWMKELERLGVPSLAVKHTGEAAHHALAHGLIARSSLSSIEGAELHELLTPEEELADEKGAAGGDGVADEPGETSASATG